MRFSIVIGAIISVVQSWYLPGIVPRKFEDGEKLPVYSSKMVSEKTQVPYSLYTRLASCHSDDLIEHPSNFGDLLTGTRAYESPYILNMNDDSECKYLCTVELDYEELERYRQMVKQEYRTEWVVDNLPLSISTAAADGSVLWFTSVPLGAIHEGKELLYNHYEFVIRYNNDQHIVGAEVIPYTRASFDPSDPCSNEIPSSFDASSGFIIPHVKKSNSKNSHRYMNKYVKVTRPTEAQEDEAETALVPFTYSVRWEKSDHAWYSRWDTYLMTGQRVEVHWLALLRYGLVVLSLSLAAATILGRTVLKDIALYNEIANSVVGSDDVFDAESAAEQGGWKLLHGDVFRKPNYFSFICVAVGTGVQLLLIVLLCGLLSTIGIVTPAYRGLLVKALLFGFILMGIPGGFTAARITRLADPEAKRAFKITGGIAFFFPGVCFGIFSIVNIFTWLEGSSAAVSPLIYVGLLLLWIFCGVPMVLLGAILGFRKPPQKVPVRTNLLARQIPTQSPFLHPISSGMIGGMVVVAAFALEFQTAMSAAWLHEYYSYFGFLFFATICAVIASAEVSLISCYMQLVNEDWQWWWRSMLTPAFSGVWVMIFSIVHAFKLQLTGITGIVLYFGYMSVVSFAIALMSGAVGLLCASWFVRSIYGAIRVD